MRALAVILGVAIALAGGGRVEAAPVGATGAFGVRAASRLAGEVITQARDRSATVRALMDELAASDVLVYVDLRFDPPVSHGTTKLVTAGPHARYLRIAIDVMLAPPDRMAVLAHELQHALEIAREPDVRDDQALRGLYRRIGWSVGESAFETQAAIDTERRTRRDVSRRARPDRP